MGTKRAYDEELQEFIKHPKHLDNGNKTVVFAENQLPLDTFQHFCEDGGKYYRTSDGPESENVITVPDTINKEIETNAPLPLVTGISTGEDDTGSGPVFCSNLFSEFFEYNFPRRKLFCHEDMYSSLLNGTPRKAIPVGPEHEADVPEFDSELARNYNNISENGGMDRFLGFCVIPMCHSTPDSSTKVDTRTDCQCLDGGSIRCVQQHVKEARLKLRESVGHEKFVDLGMLEMGEEVASKWTEEEERLFHEVVYSNPASLGKKLWEQLSIAFPSRTKKELVSYYFNVFILRRRAVQNRSNLLDVDSDDDEWRGSYRATLGVGVEDEDFVLGGSFASHGDHDSSSEDHADNDNDGGEDDFVIGDKEPFQDQTLEPNSSKLNGFEQEHGQSRSEYGFQTCDSKVWDRLSSSTPTTKGLDLLPTCSIIEEIFGCSKNGKNAIQ